MNLEINKSSRHSKITGDFAERFILYWLSKHGFECAYVDHVGIDLLAKNPHTNELMGISVKSRSRNEGKEGTYLSIPNENINKIEIACNAFNCNPYFAIVVDEKSKIWIFILSLKKLLEIHNKGEKVISWKMNDTHLSKYINDKEINIIELDYSIKNWW